MISTSFISDLDNYSSFLPDNTNFIDLFIKSEFIFTDSIVFLLFKKILNFVEILILNLCPHILALVLYQLAL